MRAYKIYVAHIPTKLSLPTLPFFITSPTRSTPISAEQMRNKLKQRCAILFEYDLESIGWHSFRRGGATAMFLAGVSDALIEVHGRMEIFYLPKIF